jgi:hypothetical protein
MGMDAIVFLHSHNLSNLLLMRFLFCRANVFNDYFVTSFSNLLILVFDFFTKFDINKTIFLGWSDNTFQKTRVYGQKMRF